MSRAERKPSPIWPAFYMIMSAMAAVGMIGVSVMTMDSRRIIDDSLATAQARLRQLETVKSERDRRHEQLSSDRVTIFRVLGACREASDIPDFGGDAIISLFQEVDYCSFYVPDGNHTLKLTASWFDIDVKSGKPIESSRQEQSWEVPLLASSGYRIDINSERNGGRVNWHLTSNHPDFAKEPEYLKDIEKFSSIGGSWSTSMKLRFPNQIAVHRWPRSKGEFQRTPHEVMKPTLRGKHNGKEAQIDFVAELHSDTPLVTTAGSITSQSVLDLIRPIEYAGGGRYIIRTDKITNPQ